MAIIKTLFLCTFIVVFHVNIPHVTCLDILDQLKADGREDFVTVLMNTDDDIASNLTSGNYTIFVPVDVTSLCRVNCTDEEIDVILNHVIYGIHSYDNLQNDANLMALSGYKVHVNRYQDTYSNEVVTVNGVPIAWHHNLRADNGIIHIVMGVISLAKDDVFTEMTSNFRMHSFIHNSKMSGLDKQAPDLLTVFVPSNFAFSELGGSVIHQITHNMAVLTDVLKNHIVRGVWYTEGLTTVSGLTNLNNETLKVTKTRVNGAKITEADIPATNGVIHLIDHVIMPKSYESPSVIG